MSKPNQQLSSLLAGIVFALATNGLASAAPGLGGGVGGVVNGAAGGVHAGINGSVNAGGINAGVNGNANGQVNGPNAPHQPQVSLPQTPNALNLANGAVHGTVTAVSGDTLTLKLANGTTQTITDAKAAAAFKAGQVVTIVQRDGKVVMIADKVPGAAESAENRAYHGVITAVTGNTLTLKLANGATQTVTVANATLNVKTGQTVTVAEHQGKLIAMADKDVDHVTSLATRAYRATVTAVNGTAVTVKLANGTSQTLTVNKNVAENLKTGEAVTLKQHGKHVVLITGASAHAKAHTDTQR